MRTTRGLVLVALTAAVLAVPALAPVRAEQAPLRSGTILGGAGVELGGGEPWEQNAAERSGCEYAADCVAWLQSGCDPALAGRDPVLTASIVRVSDLADGSTVRSLALRAPTIPPWGLFPGVVIQFWRQDCTEIPGTKLHSLGDQAPCDGYVGGGHGSCTFHIPAGATWMTLSAYVTTVDLSWTLTSAPPIVEYAGADVGGACDEFPAWNEAQVRYEWLGATSGDVRGLDPDGDGVPCGGLDGAPADWQRRADGGGYLMVESNGTVFGFGDVRPLRAPVTEPTVGLAMGPDGGYWLLAPSGAVQNRGVGFHGMANIPAGDRAASIASRPDGSGYWIFTARGRALPFGTARNLGDMRDTRLNGEIIAAVATPSGNGYWMVGSDGGIFSFGDAVFAGSTGDRRLNEPVVGMAADPDGRGYWLVAADGGVFAFDATFRGSVPEVVEPGQKLNRPVIGGIAYGDGYLMVAADGGIFSFSNKAFHGSLGRTPPPNAIVGVAAR